MSVSGLASATSADMRRSGRPSLLSIDDKDFKHIIRTKQKKAMRLQEIAAEKGGQVDQLLQKHLHDRTTYRCDHKLGAWRSAYSAMKAGDHQSRPSDQHASLRNYQRIDRAFWERDELRGWFDKYATDYVPSPPGTGYMVHTSSSRPSTSPAFNEATGGGSVSQSPPSRPTQSFLNGHASKKKRPTGLLNIPDASNSTTLLPPTPSSFCGSTTSSSSVNRAAGTTGPPPPPETLPPHLSPSNNIKSDNGSSGSRSSRSSNHSTDRRSDKRNSSSSSKAPTTVVTTTNGGSTVIVSGRGGRRANFVAPSSNRFPLRPELIALRRSTPAGTMHGHVKPGDSGSNGEGSCHFLDFEGNLERQSKHCRSMRESVRAAAVIQVKPPFKERPLEEGYHVPPQVLMSRDLGLLRGDGLDAYKRNLAGRKQRIKDMGVGHIFG